MARFGGFFTGRVFFTGAPLQEKKDRKTSSKLKQKRADWKISGQVSKEGQIKTLNMTLIEKSHEFLTCKKKPICEVLCDCDHM